MAELITIDSFLSGLKDLLKRGFSTAEVHAYLQGTLIKPESLQRFITFRPNHYTRNLVHKSKDFELLVICWGVGQKAPVHGHEGERCWSRVEKGTLRFTNYEEISENPLVLRNLARPVHGMPGHLDGPADIHEVENLPMFNEPAVSLHLYSRPYEECDIYDLVKGEKRRVRLSYDTMYGC
ncbi:MAG: cysteine dioxygenase [Candidatus Binatia bacterium]